MHLRSAYLKKRFKMLPCPRAISRFIADTCDAIGRDSLLQEEKYFSTSFTIIRDVKNSERIARETSER